MKYVFTEYRKRENTALNKAPEDVLHVAKGLGFVPFAVKSCAPKCQNFVGKVVARLQWCIEESRISRKIKRGDIVLLQAPPEFMCRRAGRKFLQDLHNRGVRFIYLIHDIGELRESDPTIVSLSHMCVDFMFTICDVLIAHNARMKDWLVERGYPSDRIIELGIFDYLCDSQTPFASAGEKNDVIIAGNLSAKKSAYLAGLKSIVGVNWKLYGPNFDRESLTGSGTSATNIEYRGSFPPDELPRKLSGTWGLVWDGDSVDTCSGATGNYLRYNNPHKLSLFLACGIPVIVWSESAEAEFVTRNEIGVTLDSLPDLPLALSNLQEQEYAALRHNANEIAKELRLGVYARQALGMAIDNSFCAEDSKS